MNSIPTLLQVLIICIQTLQKEYAELYAKKSKLGGAGLPWALPELLHSITPERLERSLFGQRFLSGIIDEAHFFRNRGLKHTAVLTLLDRCVLRMPLTATPLLTSTKVSFAVSIFTSVLLTLHRTSELWVV